MFGIPMPGLRIIPELFVGVAATQSASFIASAAPGFKPLADGIASKLIRRIDTHNVQGRTACSRTLAEFRATLNK